MKILKVYIISPSFYPAFYFGGPVYTSYNLAKALAANDVSVSVVTTNTGGQEPLDVITNKWISEGNNFRIKYYGAALRNGFSPIMYLLLWSDIKKADVVYLISVFSPPTLLTLFLSFLFKKKIVISPRGQFGKWPLSQGSRFKKIWIKIFIKPFLRIIKWHATSEQELLDIKMQFPGADVFTISNLPGEIDVYGSSHIKNKMFYTSYLNGINEDSKIIVSMGRLTEVKGFDILIKAFGKVKEHISGIKLLIAGEDFGMKERLVQLIKDKNLGNDVCLTGPLTGTEKQEFLSNADLFALPSYHENFGMTIMEALAAGTPVIASKNTPWADVEKYNCGKWVENNPEDFSNAIIQILASDMAALSRNARNFIQSNFSNTELAKEYIKMFKGNLSK